MSEKDIEQDQLITEHIREQSEFAEFEIGKHRVPWFLWVFFALIISWASISWVKFFGY